jgi:hypothetical protein
MSATAFEALATIGGNPAASSAGKVISDAPPTTAVTMPPASPAPKSMSPEGPSMIPATMPERGSAHLRSKHRKLLTLTVGPD